MSYIIENRIIYIQYNIIETIVGRIKVPFFILFRSTRVTVYMIMRLEEKFELKQSIISERLLQYFTQS